MHTTVSFLLRLMVVLIGATFASHTFAQDGPRLPSSAPVLRAPSVRLDQQQAETAPPPVVSPGLFECEVGGTAKCHDYWIVSSRRCIQHRRQGCPTCQFQYAHRTSDRRLSPGSSSDFQGWFQPGVPVCIVVHGSFVSPASAIVDSHYTYQWLKSAAPNRPLQVVFFTWPSNTLPTIVAPQIDIALLGKRSAFNGMHVIRMLTQIPKECPVCFVGHSHGARTVLAALHVLAGGHLQGFKLSKDVASGRRIRAVVAAAAVDRHWMGQGQRYDRALCATECMVNLRNYLDASLLLYPLRKPFGNQSLAYGLTTTNIQRIGTSADKVTEFDVSHLVRLGHMWPHYYRRPEIAALLTPYIHFD